MKTSEIIYREDLYPRFEPNQSLIQRYSNSVEYLPPIKINQNNILIDGYHRWKAHQLAEKNEINVEVIQTESEQKLKILAYKLNSIHGLQLSDDEKKKFAREMFGIMPEEEIANILSIHKATVYTWTKTQRENAKQELERKALELYLRAWNTQEIIADELKTPRQTISRIIENFAQNSSARNLGENFTPFLYNIWNIQKGNETEHFGSFPEVFMENLLYYHTDPMDIVFDPFAGNGTTIDICKKWLRRYYCSDLIVKPGREKDIIQHDITTGLPENLQKPDLAFIDPPYWLQARGKYSDSPNDLGNMNLYSFNSSMKNLLNLIKKWKVKKIAIVIQPTQYSNDFIWTDHIFDFHSVISDKYKILMRYILPYSTQQYNAQQVDKAKELKKCLGLNRDLVVWELNE